MAILMISHRDLIQGLVSLAATLAVMGAALFLSAGTLQWPHGLAFLAAFFILVLVSVAWLWRVNPEIFAARRRMPGEGTKSWDVVLISILLAGFLATLIVAGLDDGRFHWAPAPFWAVLVGYVLLLLGGLGSGWAQAVNRHFEPSVRIQTDRDHHVITTGPYAFVRLRATCPAPFWRSELHSRSARSGRSCLRHWLASCSSFAPIWK